MKCHICIMAAETPEYEIRRMRKEDIPQVLDLWRETNLSEGTYSIDTWFEYDPEGFYVAATNEGIVIGACSGVLQHGDLAFIGLYVVKSTLQGRGIGRKIWNKVMERVGDRNAGVNPVPDMIENYRDRAGFPIQCDWNNVVCVSGEIAIPDVIDGIPDIMVSVVTPEDDETISAIAEFDSGIFGFSRERFFPILCREEDSVTVVASRKYDDSVCGYGNIKKNIKGNALVGPLCADNSSIAELILYKLVESFPVAQNKGVTLMIVDCNQDSIDFVDKVGFSRCHGTPRLYRNAEVDIKFSKIFGQSNLNFSVF